LLADGIYSGHYEDIFVTCSMSKTNDKGKVKVNVIPAKPKTETRLMVNISTANNSKGKFSEVKQEIDRNKKPKI
jgi:hypothetical protein